MTWRNYQSRFNILPNTKKKLAKNSQRLLQFCQSGKISPISVTLVGICEGERLVQVFKIVFSNQCDQLARSCVQYLAICNKENLLSCRRKLNFFPNAK